MVGALATATSLVAMAPAQAVELAPSHVTVHCTDFTPAAGQTFRLWGAVWSEGERVPATIRVKTYLNGRWVQLKGAVMSTNRDNRYKIRIILHLKGDQRLRVIGDPKDDHIQVARKTITVTVH